MILKAGDTFYNDPDFTCSPKHLWIILTDPVNYPTEVVIVNMTSWDDEKPYKDSACILNSGDHEYISHKSWIYYGQAQVVTTKKLSEWIKKKCLIPSIPITSELLNRIREGAAVSLNTPSEILNILEYQNLID